jgi:hypothetical protein
MPPASLNALGKFKRPAPKAAFITRKIEPIVLVPA